MQSLLSPVSRGHAAFRGFVAAALGIALIAWPAITIGTVVVLFAAYALVDAGTVAVRAFGHGVSGGDRALLLLRSGIEVVAAIVAVAYPGVTASIMTVILGIYAITVNGLDLAVIGKLSRLGAKGLGWEIATGVLGVMTGVALVVWPGIGAVTLAIVFGAYLTFAGGAMLISAAVTPRGELVPSRA
jgi:uncharacterized membrane protein HdeD (DUF308 family)